jgi:hypothetical protein
LTPPDPPEPSCPTIMPLKRPAAASGICVWSICSCWQWNGQRRTDMRIRD